MKVAFVVCNDLLMTLAACLGWIRICRVRDQTFVGGLQVRGSGISSVAFLAGNLRMWIFFKVGVVDKYLLIWLQRSHRTPSPLTFTLCRFARGAFCRELPGDIHQFLNRGVTGNTRALFLRLGGRGDAPQEKGSQ